MGLESGKPGESIMIFIKTTATVVEKIKARAKSIKQEQCLTHQKAIEIAAIEAGYLSWFHVHWCVKASQKEINNAVSVDFYRDERRFPQYMNYLKTQSQGVVVEHFSSSGDVFHAAEIDGQYFYASIVAGDSPYITRQSTRLRGHDMGGVQLGVCEIHLTQEQFKADFAPSQWFVCKYGPSEPRIPLDELSQAAIHAVAYEFGIPISYWSGGFTDSVPRNVLFFDCPDGVLFYLSPAFLSLVEFAKLHPKKASKWSGNPYLGNWADAAKNGPH